MFAINEGIRVIDGHEVTTYTRDIINANILRVEAGTNGYHGGESSYGCRAYFRIEDLGSTDIRVRSLGKYNHAGFEVVIGGDSELETMITALKFITRALEDGAKEVRD